MEAHKMGEKKYKYTAKIKQPQKVAGISLTPKGGEVTEKELKALKKDAYGASLLEKGLLVIESDVPASSGSGDTIPDFDKAGKEDK
jgi:hypothetical protein